MNRRVHKPKSKPSPVITNPGKTVKVIVRRDNGVPVAMYVDPPAER
jgi:hypothetical protein